MRKRPNFIKTSTLNTPVIFFHPKQKGKSPTFYKDNSEDINSMRNTMTTIFTGTQQQEQNSEGTSDVSPQQETSQQEVANDSNAETTQQEEPLTSTVNLFD